MVYRVEVVDAEAQGNKDQGWFPDCWRCLVYIVCSTNFNGFRIEICVGCRGRRDNNVTAVNDGVVAREHAEGGRRVRVDCVSNGV